MRTAVLLALAMFVATPIVQLAAERDAAAQLWKPRSKTKTKAKAKAPATGDPKAKTAAKTSRKAKAKAPSRSKKKPAAKRARKANQRKGDAAADDDFAIFEETEGDLE